MPWCDTCSRFLNPTSLNEAGECPTCGQAVDAPALATAAATDVPAVPWHFKLLLIALVLYLAFRAVQGVMWVAHHV